MDLRTVSKWGKILKGAINTGTVEQVLTEDELLQLGIPAVHWRELEVQARLERDEWVIINVNVLGTHQHLCC